MVIPFMVDKKLLAFHGPLADKKYSPKTVTPFFPGYKPVVPPAFDISVVLDVRFMDRVFLIHAHSWHGLTKFSVNVKTNDGVLGFSTSFRYQGTPTVLSLACCWSPFTSGKV